MASSETTAMDDGPAEKTKKYDRQLRSFAFNFRAKYPYRIDQSYGPGDRKRSKFPIKNQ